jgi:hypothetical protein
VGVNESSSTPRKRADEPRSYETESNTSEPTLPAEESKGKSHKTKYESAQNRIYANLEQSIKEPVQYNEIDKDQQRCEESNLHSPSPSAALHAKATMLYRIPGIGLSHSPIFQVRGGCKFSRACAARLEA